MNLMKLFTSLLSKHKILAILVIVVSVFVILGGVGLFSVSAYIIAYCGLTPSIAEIMVPVVGVRFFGLSRGILRYLERLVAHDTTFRLLSDFRNWLYDKISGTKSSEVMLLDKEDAFTRLVDDIERLQEFYLRTFNPYIAAVIIGIIGTIFLSLISPLIGVVFLFFYSLAIILLPLIVSFSTKGLFKEHIQDISLSKDMILENISGLADIIANGAFERKIEKLKIHLFGIYGIERKLAFWKGLSTAVINMLMNYALLLAVVVAGALLASNQVEAVMIPVIAYAVFALFEGAQPVAIVLQKIEESNISANRIDELSNRCVNEEDQKLNIDSTANGIRFNNVSFKYNNMKELLLKDINLTLTQGKKIALVGTSGGGKSTLSYLLLGWLQPNEGEIIYQHQPEEQFSVVNQKVYFFNTSIGNNLRIANIHATDVEILEVLDQVELNDFIQSLPNGIDTELGDGDLKLSGGQRQRLAIARALLRKTNYFIFDEITAGLDLVTEKKVVHTLHKIMADKGILVLTHRLIHMEAYDEILVLEEGKIKERGTHNSLLNSNSLYQKMYITQQNYLK